MTCMQLVRNSNWFGGGFNGDADVDMNEANLRAFDALVFTTVGYICSVLRNPPIQIVPPVAFRFLDYKFAILYFDMLLVCNEAYASFDILICKEIFKYTRTSYNTILILRKF